MAKKKKPQTKSGKIINTISNCIFIPVMLILAVYFIFSLSIIGKNGVPSFFGQSYVRIMSNSMKPSGFQKGDIVMLKKVKVSEIKEGDIIVFYACLDHIPNYDGTKELALEKDFMTGKKTFDTTVFFHQVYKIRYDSYGDTWFYTYGTNNKRATFDPDSDDIEANYFVDNETRADHVVGVYTESWLTGVLEFISSTMGMIILIIVPSAILLFTLLLNIIEISDQMIKEKKQKQALAEGDLKERELDVTTIIEEDEDQT